MGFRRPQSEKVSEVGLLLLPLLDCPAFRTPPPFFVSPPSRPFLECVNPDASSFLDLSLPAKRERLPCPKPSSSNMHHQTQAWAAFF